MTEQLEAWPAGATWVFQGTIAEDATGGTHVCTLTVVPGAGNEMQVLYGNIRDGNTGTAQTVNVTVNDGAGHSMAEYITTVSDTAQTARSFPTLDAITANTATKANGVSPSLLISGNMQVVLTVSTAAISVTQTFAVVCRLKTGQKPTAVLADTVGTPSLTVNTNQVF